MKIINPSTRLYVNGQPLAWKYGIDMLKAIERIGRTCYKSEDKITDDSYETFVRNLIKRGHLSVIEHCSVTADIVCDRGVTHEIVRHRIGSYSQESTRYCNYSADKYGNEITVIDPGPAFGWDDTPAAIAKRNEWTAACLVAEVQYLQMLENGASPQEARSVLPNSLKTEIWVTYNLREWRHFFQLRCAPAAHPQMQEVARMLLAEMTAYVPIIFDDIYEEVFHKMNDTIANRLRCLRADHDMSQEKLAEELDVSRTTVLHVENGDRMPSLFVVMAYAEYFSVSVDWILYGKEHEE